MAKQTVWEFTQDGASVRVTCVPKGNRYCFYLGDDHLTDVDRLPPKQMHYGMEAKIRIGTEDCLFVVWEEIPDLVVRGKLLHRNVDYAKAKEARRNNMEMMYTTTAIFGVIALLGVFVFAWLGFLNDETFRGWTAVMCAGIWMIGMGLYYRGKWIEQIP